MSVLADDVAAHDWSVAGAGICGKPGRSMATLTSQRKICTSVAVADRGPARKIGILKPPPDSYSVSATSLRDNNGTPPRFWRYGRNPARRSDRPSRGRSGE